MNKLFFIAGPTGVGKSTLINSFKNYYTYLEDVDQNPYIQELFEGGEFNAFRSQLWFIDKINEAILNWDKSSLMFFDQDPKAVVNVYSKYFLNNGGISGIEFSIIQNHLSCLEKNIDDLGINYETILLMANPEVLKKRVNQRDGKIMNNEWFEEIHALFYNYYKNLDSLVIKTDNISKTSLHDIIKTSLDI